MMHRLLQRIRAIIKESWRCIQVDIILASIHYKSLVCTTYRFFLQCVQILRSSSNYNIIDWHLPSRHHRRHLIKLRLSMIIAKIVLRTEHHLLICGGGANLMNVLLLRLLILFDIILTLIVRVITLVFGNIRHENLHLLVFHGAYTDLNIKYAYSF